jgi:hypothetical protein
MLVPIRRVPSPILEEPMSPTLRSARRMPGLSRLALASLGLSATATAASNSAKPGELTALL